MSLGRIALALTEQEIEELDLRSVDTISALGQQREWTPTQVSVLLKVLLVKGAGFRPFGTEVPDCPGNGYSNAQCCCSGLRAQAGWWPRASAWLLAPRGGGQGHISYRQLWW